MATAATGALYAPAPMLSRVGWRAAAVALVVLSAQPALSQNREDAESYLVAAMGLFSQGEYEEALALVLKARSQTSDGGAELEASLALWEGLLRLHLGQKDDGPPHVLRAFLLRPDMALPARLSPKIKLRVEELRVDAKKQLEKMRLVAEQDRAERERAEKERLAKELADRKRDREADPVVHLEPKPTVDTGTADKDYVPNAELAQKGSRSHVAPLVLGGVALGAGAAGAWFGLQSQDAITRARAERVQLSVADGLGAAQDQALVANIAFAAAGSAAVAALVTFLVSR